MKYQQKQSLSSYGEVLGIHDHFSSLRDEHQGVLVVIIFLHILNIKWILHAIVSPVQVVIDNKEVVSRLKNVLPNVSQKIIITRV